MTEKSDKNVLKWEEPGEYTIEVDKTKNRIKYRFFGYLKSRKDIPNYVEHVKEALDELENGYRVLAWGFEVKATPSFSVTKPFKESHKLMQKKRIDKMAAVVKKPTQKIIIGVLGKLSGNPIKVFNDENEAEKWMDE